MLPGYSVEKYPMLTQLLHKTHCLLAFLIGSHKMCCGFKKGALAESLSVLPAT